MIVNCDGLMVVLVYLVVNGMIIELDNGVVYIYGVVVFLFGVVIWGKSKYYSLIC